MAFSTDQILWWNVGVWGELGYAVPNFGDDVGTLNSNIHVLVDAIGRNLQAIMQHEDADLNVPPSLNTVMRVHKLVLRARSLLAARSIAANQLNMEAVHATPAPEVFIIYPARYFKVRNRMMKEWSKLAFFALTEAMQHTENRKSFEISTEFAGLIGQYFHRIYKRMATELFGVSAEEADKLDFTLTDEQFKNYNPGQFFTSTEMIDTVSPFRSAPTEDDFKPVSRGIAATDLVGLMPYPASTPYQEPTDQAGTQASTGKGNAFSPAPSP